MRVRRTSGLVGAVLVVTAWAVAPAGAATPAQRCTGPSPTTQSGRATVSPGLNALPTRQTITTKINLFSCSPSATSGGSGTLKSTYTTPTPQTCALFALPHVLKATAMITWKNLGTSALSLTISLTGSTRLANVTGKVTGGWFAGHSVTGQFRYKPVVSPDGNSLWWACANKAVPGLGGRVSVVAFNLFTTNTFVIT